jgi:hypothetical protein
MEMTCPDCGMCESHGTLNEMKKGQKDSNGVTKCWSGYHAQGTKKGKNGGTVRNCVPNEGVEENFADGKHPGRKGLAKRSGVNTKASVSSLRNTAKHSTGEKARMAHWLANMKAGREKADEGLTADEAFDIIEEMIERIAETHGVDPDLVWEDFDVASDEELYMLSEDWQKVNKHDKTDGLSRKAVSAYRREHPGSKLKTAVTTKPSKLKKGSKSAKRRKSFCARMSGMKKHRAGAKTKRDPNSPINKALRRWNC